MLYVRVCVENKCKISPTTKKTFGKLADISTKLRQVKRTSGWKKMKAYLITYIYYTNKFAKQTKVITLFATKYFINSHKNLLAMEVQLIYSLQDRY